MDNLGKEASVPDLVGGLILQNDLEFHLGEEDEIFEGYGSTFNSYPYRQYNGYSNELECAELEVAVLENDFLRAVFLPQLGGRLWSLWDKERERNLLYTNDVIRFRNLAVRNAWFSGGVEWNIGVIGHSPLTTEPLFTAVLEYGKGVPVLRMYEYERIRQVTYQMDFWLGEEDRFLNARMRIVNFGEEVTPMYWWSNIAVPEHDGGRIFVPAEKAYTYRNGGVYKVDIPVVEGIDITRYQNIPSSVDYFFDIPKTSPKYIANVDSSGYGLLQMSTERLQSRKLFSWGKKSGGSHWQEFLTEKAGRYVEIQAGLGKTQYGCLPMAPHTAWEWLERYGAVCLDQSQELEPTVPLTREFTGWVGKLAPYREMKQVLEESKGMARQRAAIRNRGRGYGALKDVERKQEGHKGISNHLDFETVTPELKIWENFLRTGILEEPDILCSPPPFVTGDVFFKRLKESAQGDNRDNWFAHYQLGLLYFQQEDFERAQAALERSLHLRQNPWSYHGIACVFMKLGCREKAKEALLCGLKMQSQDVSYVKEAARLLELNGSFPEIVALYRKLDRELQEEGRIRLCYIRALAETGQFQMA